MTVEMTPEKAARRAAKLALRAKEHAGIVEPSLVLLKKPKAAKSDKTLQMTPERAARRAAKRAKKLALKARKSA